MVHPVCALEATWERALREGRRLRVLATVRQEAATALARGDLPSCITNLTVLAAMGGPLFGFQPPARTDDVAGWQAILERFRHAVEDSAAHNQVMRGRIARHLTVPRPWMPAWRASVARTMALQKQYVHRWHAAVALIEASQDATAT